jgi:hypothetical protein
VNELCIAESISFNYFINELKMGLSKARNIALKYLLDNILSAEYIMFPDDDSSFDSVFFDNFQVF